MTSLSDDINHMICWFEKANANGGFTKSSAERFSHELQQICGRARELECHLGLRKEGVIIPFSSKPKPKLTTYEGGGHDCA